MDKRTAQELIEKTFNNAFSEKQFTVFAKNLLNDFEDKHNHYSGNLIWDDYKEHINTYKRIGKYVDPNGEALDILIVEVKSVAKLERARTTLRNFVIKHLSRFEKDYALVAFYSKEDNGSDWRFSFIKLEYRSEMDEEKGKVKTKKEFTPAKRYSFLVGKYEKTHTAKNQLLPLLQNISNNPAIEELEAAFSIEKVTDEFFNQYKDLYIKLYEHFENDNKVKAEFEKAGIDNTRFTKKLLGQIVFLYFLQKKGWLGVDKNEHWGTGNKRFVQELFEQARDQKLNFFRDKLQFLFYEALAKERDNENSYYKRFECRIPFLNGGLFEANYNWQEANISIPENLFRNEEKNKSGDVGTGILDVFDRYNFTIKEDEPLDKEVAVDPEMLGKVFENMLDITERKSKGAFYTPREIVHYMCQESLIHYLDNSLNNGADSYQELDSDQTKLFSDTQTKKGQAKIELVHGNQTLVPKKDIELFIREGHFALENDERVATRGETKTYKYQLPESIRKNADLIDQQLSCIKICDPAIGSGAFPVGLLHELVNAMLVLKPHLTYNYLTEKLKGFGFTHRESINDSRYIYRLKRHIIQESIYGVDIDSSAIDIARLRLWLSLVVDEDDLDPIETLPNLDYKIVCGNSLIGLPDGAMKDLEVEAELENLKEKFYNITDEKEKKDLRKQINTKIRELLDSAEQFAGYNIDFDFKLFFSEVWREKGGFDIVIGNPPYLDYRKIDTIITQKIKFKNTGTNRPNLYIYFIDKADSLINNSGLVTYICPNQFLAIDSGKSIRRHLLINRDIKFVKDVSYVPVFNNASTYTCVWMSSKLIKHQEISIGRIETLNALTNVHFTVKQNTILEQSDFIIPINQRNEVIKKLDKYKCILKSKAEIFWGTSASGYGKQKLSKEDYRELNSIQKSKYIPLIQTADIKSFYIDWKGDYLPRHIFSNIALENFDLPKFVIGRLTKSLQASIDKEKYGVGKSSVLINLKYNAHILVSILNSSIINYWYLIKFESTHMAGGYIRFDIPYLEKIPLPEPKSSTTFEIIVDYINFGKFTNDFSVNFFSQLNDSLVFELYFPEEIKSAGKEILKHLGDLKPITDDMSEEEKLAIIQSEFERLHHPDHPVRLAIETLDSVEEVRIIKEALK
jgi:hypothetical protein